MRWQLPHLNQTLTSTALKRHTASLRDYTASISPSIQDVRKLHALSPPLAGRYALDTTYVYTSYLAISMCHHFFLECQYLQKTR